MDIQMLTRFFMWCTIMNFAFLMLSFLLLGIAGDFIYKLHSKWFSMQREKFNMLIYSFLGLYKILWLVLNVVPWVALRVIG
ncbi:MAG TPA: hypothetical protein DEW46_05800 [Verrucomicrobia bacterium]|nr:hypothetical protein [Verrucomicrobiota bacterium]